MKKSIFLFMLLLIVLAPIAFSITLQDLISFFNFNFFTATINVTNYNDFMVDANENNINDTLKIELTTDGSAGTYLIIINLEDENIIKNETNITLGSGANKFNISFSSEFFTKNKFNYTIKIYEEDYSLRYSKESIETQFYGNYESGTNILNISDSSINNNFIKINITLNSTKNNTYEIIAYLKYNNSVLFSKINETINSGINNILINFSNETIKNTHYTGKFNLTSIKINNKIIKANHLTNPYNYKDFAQSSYFIGFFDLGFDSDNNDLFDYLRLSSSIEIKNNDTYKIDLAMYDLFDNFIKQTEKIETLASGTNNVIIDINGTEIYDKKLNGPFIVRYAKLIKNNEIVDQVGDFHITQNYNYTNFEKPNLPDLNLTIGVSNDYHYGKNNLTFNVTVNNIGNKAAFNIVLEIFDNNTYSRNESINILSANNYKKYIVNFINVSDIEFNAIVDFDNFIEESNESNNIIRETIKINKKPVLEEINNITANETDLILITANATDSNSDNLTFYINNSYFSKNNNVFSWQTTTIDAGNYTLMINASDGFLYDSKIFKIIILDNLEIDTDNDGINDTIDNIIGDRQSINTSTLNISLIIGNSSNISKVFDGMESIEFKDNGLTIVEFNFNFSSSKLNLSNIIINKQNNNETGFIIVKGINLNQGRSKTIYLDKINISQNGICIKDAEITTINEINENCNQEKEYKVECDSTLQYSYNCTYINSTGKYKITGLNNSGIKQIGFTKPDTLPSTSSGSSDGGGSRIAISCIEQWQCTSWTNCINNIQTRTCVDINKCGSFLNKPLESRQCTITEQKPIEISEKDKEINETEIADDKEKINKLKALADITGKAINIPRNANPVIGAFIVFFIIVVGLGGYFYFTYKGL